MLLMLGISRRAYEGEKHVRKNEWAGWRPTHMMGTKVTGKTLGLLGMGRIAQFMGFACNFCSHHVCWTPSCPFIFPYVFFTFISSPRDTKH
jgi:lactate dehydrogenase-like 2-hydroxyacid dehydrogenase